MEVTIHSLDFARAVRKTWVADLVEQSGTLLTLLGTFDREIIHPDLGVIRRGTISYEYYWLDRWFNVFKFMEPDGAFRNFYCNVSMPPDFDGTTLSYVDLDIDIVVDEKGGYDILDEAEFAKNAAEYRFPDEVIKNAKDSVSVLISMIEGRFYPFDRFE